MKTVKRKGNKTVFRVNTEIYPEVLIGEVFGSGKKVGKYILFESDLGVTEVYEKFNNMLEEMME